MGLLRLPCQPCAHQCCIRFPVCVSTLHPGYNCSHSIIVMFAPYMSSCRRQENCPTYLWRRCAILPRLISLHSTLTTTHAALHGRLRLATCVVVAVEVPLQVDLLRAAQESVMEDHLSGWQAVPHQRQHPCCQPKALCMVQSVALTGAARQQRQTLSVLHRN